MLLSAVDANWSAFEHTLTPLPGDLSTSFLQLTSKSEARIRDTCFSSVPGVHNERRSVSETVPREILMSFGNDANMIRSFHMTSSPGRVLIRDDGGENPGLSYTDSHSTAVSSRDAVTATSTQVELLKDINIRQVVAGRRGVRDSQTNDPLAVNKPVRGKENMRPASDNPSVLLTARDHLDLERRPWSQECGITSKWRSPARRSVSTASGKRSSDSQMCSWRNDNDHRAEVIETFSALPVAADESFYSSSDQRSPEKTAEDGLNNAEYKRSSSTPVKDKLVHEPIRFRRRQRRNSQDEDGDKKQRQTLSQSLDALLIQDTNESATHWNGQSSATQSANTHVGMADPVDVDRLSVVSLSGDSLINGDMTYESTVLMSLPTPTGAALPHRSQDVDCPEVGTQTSFLSPTNGTIDQDKSGHQRDKLKRSNDKVAETDLTAGNNYWFFWLLVTMSAASGWLCYHCILSSVCPSVTFCFSE